MESFVLAGEGNLSEHMVAVTIVISLQDFTFFSLDLLWKKLQCPRLVSIQTNYLPIPFPLSSLTVSHMFMHESLTSFRQMLPLVTIN